ncbi:hypothetical protein EGW08_006522 [Elysia chlorotica]|uniref:Uncharacterized protein n=1 Tax=Elysia chlorotica TaxID=188477 RepID=A0A433TW35_ELYCH|nr:hypothetical protein EGW08_006522 [Elysia chlorotica]
MVVPLVKLSPLLHDYILNIISSFAPPILAVFLCGLLWERACEESAFRSLLLGLLLAVLRLVWSLFYRREQCGDTPGQPAPQIISNFHFLHFSIFVFVLCTACCAAGSVFSEPINEVHMYRLLFWLRHSKKDRVDLDELDEAYQALQKEVKTTDPVSESQIDPKLETDALKDVKTEPPNTGVESLQTSTGPAQPKLNTNEDKDNLTVAPAKTRILSMNTIRACCVCKQGSDRLVTKNELRETVKQRADIHEIPVQESSLNLHALLLLLIIAGLWGFLA